MKNKIIIQQGNNKILLVNNEFYRWDKQLKKWVKINLKNKNL